MGAARAAEASSLEATGLSKDDAAAERGSLNQRRDMLRLMASQVVPGRVVVRLDDPAPASVLVVGSVRNPTAVTWEQGRNVDDSLDQSGGPTTEADKDEIYHAAEKSLFRRLRKKVQVQGGARCAERGVLGCTSQRARERANAADGPFSAACYVVKPDGSTVASFVRVRDVEPGDVVMVPPSTEVKVRTRSLVRDIAQILGSIALGAAGIAAVAR